MRGLAAVIMLQGHVFHSFTESNLRGESPYVLSQFIGGITPAVFLFLTGVTLAFLMDSRTHQGLTGGQRVWAALRRAGYLGGLAIAFRMQLWLFAAGQSPWTDIFKVDILNCMAIGIAVLAPLAFFTTLDRVRFGAATGAFIAIASPVIAGLDWSGIHPFVKHYIAPDTNFFSFFPWAAFVAFGLSAGSVIRLVRPEDMQRMMQWAMLVGLGLIWSAQYASNLPYSLYSNSDFWVNSPGLIFIKLGILLVMASVAYLWTRFAAPEGWSWIRQLGTTSLLVYWVHTEIVYGRWFGEYKERLSNVQTALVAVTVISAMVLLSTARTHLPALLKKRISAPPEPVLNPASGD